MDLKRKRKARSRKVVSIVERKCCHRPKEAVAPEHKGAKMEKLLKRRPDELELPLASLIGASDKTLAFILDSGASSDVLGEEFARGRFSDAIRKLLTLPHTIRRTVL